MDIIYVDCRDGLSVPALVAALAAASGVAEPPPGETRPGGPREAVLVALGGRPCPPEELTAVYALERFLSGFGQPSLYFSPLPLSQLAPDASDLVTGLAVGGAGGPVTAAGAALVRALGRGEVGPFVCRAWGTGRGRGAVVRVFLGGIPETREEVAVLEANLDDFNPEFYPHLVDLLLGAGALDVYLTPVIMKKGRPGTQITVLSPLALESDLARRVLAETSTLGVRLRREARVTCPRRFIRLVTPYGEVAAKVSLSPDGRYRVKPEYEDCRRLAKESGVPLTEVYRAALGEAWRRVPTGGKGDPGVR